MAAAVFGSFAVGVATYASGLTVKPASLQVAVPWGESAPAQVLVSNTTDAPGMYQAALEPASAGSVAPDGFRLMPGESQLLMLQVRGRLGGAVLAVAALPLDTREVAVGSGVKVPVGVQLLMPWWLVVLAWGAPLVALAWWWLQRRRPSPRVLPAWVVFATAAVIVASLGLLGVLAMSDWPLRPPTPAPKPPAAAAQTYRLTVDFGDDQPLEAEVPATGPATAFSLLQAAAAQQRLAVESRAFGSLGVLVTGIGGVHNDVGVKRYWYLWVNGEFARTSASTITLTPGDRVEWRYVSEMKPE